MSALEELCRRVHHSRGMFHKLALEALRDFLNTTPEERLIEMISTFSSKVLLRHLWEAGLTRPLQEAVLKRYEELK
jgi:hypothetical protein